MTQPSLALEVQDLDVRFGSTHAVRGVSFTVSDGESFGIVGESGCGKTTVLRCLAGLNTKWSGTIRLAGQVRSHHRDLAAARLAQMVFQDPYGSLHPRHTVDRVLAEVCQIHGLDDVEGRIDRVLRQVGLGPSFRFRYPHQLSGGQRQRVAIARALILQPRILLLDEPTSALDVSVQAEILNLFRRLRREFGLTLVLVTHNLAVVTNLCDRLVVMHTGRVVEALDAEVLRTGTPQEAYTRQLLAASRGYDRSTLAAAEALEMGL
ncbi:MAG: ABC transporter ATP-binding protein [Alphaproteobacteria bacterium]|nr:MAG: ABC transporter ATP-binding protein [Alphaproteobacteria bacterium]